LQDQVDLVDSEFEFHCFASNIATLADNS